MTDSRELHTSIDHDETSMIHETSCESSSAKLGYCSSAERLFESSYENDQRSRYFPKICFQKTWKFSLRMRKINKFPCGKSVSKKFGNLSQIEMISSEGLGLWHLLRGTDGRVAIADERGVEGPKAERGRANARLTSGRPLGPPWDGGAGGGGTQGARFRRARRNVVKPILA
ncbi:unnamed protein product [Nesidiocoris tenuis]|uniref:Uncharacterized protein n=1 Tax=Nesidiocoris tenuis TaxID=355587 RepID=A0A6H5GIX6_9HEMI|nr:unnamed protein product [Nesidiocoris tenuis]